MLAAAVTVVGLRRPTMGRAVPPTRMRRQDQLLPFVDARAWDLAQVNIARLREPLDSAALTDFVAALDSVNAEAESAPGFIWRLQADDGNATSIRAFEWDENGTAGVIVNVSTWQSPEDLRAFVYSGLHRVVLRRRREWFHRVAEAMTALWWVPAGHRPTTGEAEDAIRSLRMRGPTASAFGLEDAWPATDH